MRGWDAPLHVLRSRGVPPLPYVVYQLGLNGCVPGFVPYLQINRNQVPESKFKMKSIELKHETVHNINHGIIK